MWFKRRRQPPPGERKQHTQWVDGGSGVSWESHGVMDYGRFYIYRDTFGDQVVLPRNLVRTIQEQRSEQHVGAAATGERSTTDHGQARTAEAGH